MAKFVSKHDESIRLFQNPVLEFFSHIHPATPVVVYGPVCIWFAFHAVATQGTAESLMGMVGGLALWTFVEYWFHRVLFHYHPRSGWGKRVMFLIHGVHHDYPQDSTRLVMPLLVSVPLASLFYGIFLLVFGTATAAVFAGFILGYIAYDSLHYAVHHLRLESRPGRWIKRNHLRHHYTDEHNGFGVSSPIWDYVFRTMPAPSATGPSPSEVTGRYEAPV